MLTGNQLLLPLQAQQLGRSYTGRVLMHVEITVRHTLNGQLVSPPCSADIQRLCIGELPILVGSALCHTASTSPMSCYFIVNGQCKVIVSQEKPCDPQQG